MLTQVVEIKGCDEDEQMALVFCFEADRLKVPMRFHDTKPSMSGSRFQSFPLNSSLADMYWPPYCFSFCLLD